MTEQADVEPIRGPAIPAAELKKRILDLISSLQSREDTNQLNVEKQMGAQLTEDQGSEGRFSMRGNIADGGSYWYFLRKLQNEPASNITFYLYHGEEVPDDALPKTCTLSFEQLAKEIKARGFRQADGQTWMKLGDITWGFRKEMPEHNVAFGILIHLYHSENTTENGQLCVKKISIGSDPINE